MSSQPTPEAIKSARLAAGLSQARAGQLMELDVMTWSRYERGIAGMDRAKWDMFLLLTGQHPDYLLMPRRKAA